MHLTAQQRVALRLAIESPNGKVRFARSFFSGKSLGPKVIAEASAKVLAKQGLGTLTVDGRNTGLFTINDTGKSVYQETRPR